jgi:hypothetical protein
MYGTNHPDYAAVLSELATLFTLVKQFEEADPRRCLPSNGGCLVISTNAL